MKKLVFMLMALILPVSLFAAEVETFNWFRVRNQSGYLYGYSNFGIIFGYSGTKGNPSYQRQQTC